MSGCAEVEFRSIFLSGKARGSVSLTTLINCFPGIFVADDIGLGVGWARYLYDPLALALPFFADKPSRYLGMLFSEILV